MNLESVALAIEGSDEDNFCAYCKMYSEQQAMRAPQRFDSSSKKYLRKYSTAELLILLEMPVR